MDWEAVAAVAQVVGAIGVVVSIVYLALQVRESTRVARGQAAFDAAHSWAMTNEVLAHAPDEVLALLVRWASPGFARGDLSEVEEQRLSLIFRSIFQKLEGQFFLHKHGLLEPGLWEQRRAIGRGMIELPHQRDLWVKEQAIATWSREFVEAIESAPSAPDMSSVHRLALH